MAAKSLLDSVRLLNQIQQNESTDGNVQILTKLDLTDFDSESQFQLTPVTLLERHHGFKFRICVMRADVDNLSLSLKISQANKDINLKWPLTVKWKVSVINESTEQTFDFTPIFTTHTPWSLENQENQVSDYMLINLNRIKDFIINNNLLFQWNIEVVPSELETLSNMENSGEIQDIDKLKAQIESVIGLVRENVNKLNSADSCKQMEEIKTKVSHCELDEGRLVIMENKVNEADKRIDKLVEQFQTQADTISTFMSEFNGVLSHVDVTEGTDTGTLYPRTDNMTHHPDASAESEDSSRSLHFLLVGESKAGKSATGNSILLKKVFKPNLHTKAKNKPIVNTSQVRLSNLNACITVVESHNSILDDYFNICPEGFDAILYVVSYNRLQKHNYKIYYENPATKERHEIKNNFGILLITGADSIELDYPNQDFHTIFGTWKGGLCNLEHAVHGRVVLFDNTTTSEKKKIEQLTKLLEIVDNLPNRPTRLNKDLHMKYMMSSFKTSISKLHFLKHGRELKQILNRFMEKYRTDFQQQIIFQSIKNTAERVMSLSCHSQQLHVYGIYDIEESMLLDETNVLVFGKQSESIEAFITQTESMGIRAHYRPIHLPLHTSNYTGIILVIPNLKLSQEEQEMIRNYISIDDFKAKSILVVTDVDSENIKKREAEFLERCRDETGVFKELYEFCSGRIVLFDCKTNDAIRRLQQEANLVNILLDLTLAHKKTKRTSPISYSSLNNPQPHRGGGFGHPHFNSRYLIERERDEIDLQKLKKPVIDVGVRGNYETNFFLN